MEKFNNFNMYSPEPCAWTSFLKEDQNQDPYALFKDSISLMLEKDALLIQNHLMSAHPEYSKEVALKMAICLMMEKMLALQNEHIPSALDTMIISLFTEMPSLHNFRSEIIFQAKIEAEKRKKPGFFSRLIKKIIG
jgi:hypothetical protein